MKYKKKKYIYKYIKFSNISILCGIIKHYACTFGKIYKCDNSVSFAHKPQKIGVFSHKWSYADPKGQPDICSCYKMAAIV